MALAKRVLDFEDDKQLNMPGQYPDGDSELQQTASSPSSFATTLFQLGRRFFGLPGINAAYRWFRLPRVYCQKITREDGVQKRRLVTADAGGRDPVTPRRVSRRSSKIRPRKRIPGLGPVSSPVLYSFTTPLQDQLTCGPPPSFYRDCSPTLVDGVNNSPLSFSFDFNFSPTPTYPLKASPTLAYGSQDDPDGPDGVDDMSMDTDMDIISDFSVDEDSNMDIISEFPADEDSRMDTNSEFFADEDSRMDTTSEFSGNEDSMDIGSEFSGNEDSMDTGSEFAGNEDSNMDTIIESSGNEDLSTDAEISFSFEGVWTSTPPQLLQGHQGHETSEATSPLAHVCDRPRLTMTPSPLAKVMIFPDASISVPIHNSTPVRPRLIMTPSPLAKVMISPNASIAVPIHNSTPGRPRLTMTPSPLAKVMISPDAMISVPIHNSTPVKSFANRIADCAPTQNDDALRPPVNLTPAQPVASPDIQITLTQNTVDTLSSLVKAKKIKCMPKAFNRRLDPDRLEPKGRGWHTQPNPSHFRIAHPKQTMKISLAPQLVAEIAEKARKAIEEYKLRHEAKVQRDTKLRSNDASEDETKDLLDSPFFSPTSDLNAQATPVNVSRAKKNADRLFAEASRDETTDLADLPNVSTASFSWENDLSTLSDAPSPLRKKVTWPETVRTRPFYRDALIADVQDSMIEKIKTCPDPAAERARVMKKIEDHKLQESVSPQHSPTGNEASTYDVSSPQHSPTGNEASTFDASSPQHSPSGNEASTFDVSSPSSNGDSTGFRDVPQDIIWYQKESIDESEISWEIQVDLLREVEQKLRLSPPTSQTLTPIATTDHPVSDLSALLDLDRSAIDLEIQRDLSREAEPIATTEPHASHLSALLKLEGSDIDLEIQRDLSRESEPIATTDPVDSDLSALLKLEGSDIDLQIERDFLREAELKKLRLSPPNPSQTLTPIATTDPHASDLSALLKLEGSDIDLEIQRDLVREAEQKKLRLSPPNPSQTLTPITTTSPLVSDLTATEALVLADAVQRSDHGKITGLRFTKNINAHDLSTLLPNLFNGDKSAWINDNIVNSYLEILINHQNEKEGHKHVTNGPAPHVHAFLSMFYTNLAAKKQTVTRWSKKKNLNGLKFLDGKLVLFPICEKSHWRLVAIKPQERRIEYYDSMGNGGERYTRLARDYLQMELGEHYIASEWHVDLEQKSSRQKNGSDCGVFTVLNALVLLRNDDHKRVLSTTGMEEARKRIAITLLAEKPTTEMG